MRGRHDARPIWQVKAVAQQSEPPSATAGSYAKSMAWLSPTQNWITPMRLGADYDDDDEVMDQMNQCLAAHLRVSQPADTRSVVTQATTVGSSTAGGTSVSTASGTTPDSFEQIG